MTRCTFPAVLLLCTGALIGRAQAPSAVMIPAAASLPILARLMTDKKIQPPPCTLQVVTEKRDNVVCADPNIDWSQYSHVEVGPVEVVPNHLRKPLSAVEIEQMRAALTASLTRQFSNSKAQENGRTLILRATITGIARSNRAVNVIGLAAIQTPLSFGGASTHFDLVDADNNRTVAELTISRRGRTYDAIPSVQSLGHAKKSLGRTPKQVNQDIQLLRNRFNATTVARARLDGGQSGN